ncbi:MAG: hypothetical protein RBU28_06770 [Bacteroidales bacterium]|jgi:hypothetical protein|nr:hypothetical protein [Bacteroidales bacterium]
MKISRGKGIRYKKIECVSTKRSRGHPGNGGRRKAEEKKKSKKRPCAFYIT